MNLGKLERVEVRQIWAREDTHFTTWLAKEENIAFLGEELNLDLEVLAQEEYVGPFRADLLCRDTATEKYVCLLRINLEKQTIRIWVKCLLMRQVSML